VAERLDPVDDTVVDLARQMYRLFREGDLAYFEILDPEIEWHVSESIPGGGHLHGLAEVIGFLEASGELFEGGFPDPEEFISAGDKLVVLGTWRGRARSTGVTVEAPFAHVGEFRDRKLVRFRNYIDSGKILQALGESPPA
jgi:uncharacterized protein